MSNAVANNAAAKCERCCLLEVEVERLRSKERRWRGAFHAQRKAKPSEEGDGGWVIPRSYVVQVWQLLGSSLDMVGAFHNVATGKLEPLAIQKVWSALARDCAVVANVWRATERLQEKLTCLPVEDAGGRR